MRSKTATLLLVALLASGCGNTPDPEAAETQSAPVAKAAETPVEVKVVKLERTAFPFRTFSSGKLEAARQVTLKAAAGGLITEIALREGAAVKKGQVLLRLDDRALHLNLEQAQLSLKEATLNKNDKLLVYGGVYGVDTSVNAKKLDQILVETGYYRAQQAIERAELELKDAVLYAPFDGVVAGLKVQRHQQVAPGEEIARLIDPGSYEAVFPLLEQEAVQVRPGQRVRVIPSAMPDRELTAEVTSLDPVVNDQGLITVRAGLRGAGGMALFESMKVEAVLERSLPGQLVVPRSAVVLRSGREVVFTYDEKSGLAKWNYVKVSYRNDVSAAIAEGLEPGMAVIWDGNLNLDHDAVVRPDSGVKRE